MLTTVSLGVIALIASIQLANAGDCNYGLWQPYFTRPVIGGNITDGGLAYAAGVCQTKVVGASTEPVTDLAFMVQCDYSGSEPAANVLLYEVGDDDCSGTPRETIALPEGDFMCCEACDLYCPVSQLTVDAWKNSPDCNAGILGNSDTYSYSIYTGPSQDCYEGIIPFLTLNQTFEFITSRMFEISDSALFYQAWFGPDCNGSAGGNITFELNECSQVPGLDVSYRTTLELLVEDDMPDMVMASDLTGSEYGNCNYGKWKPLFFGDEGEGASGRALAFAENICQTVVTSGSSLEFGSSFVVRCGYGSSDPPAYVWVYDDVTDCSGMISQIIPLESGQYQCRSDLSCGLDQLVVKRWPNSDCGASTLGNNEAFTYGIYTAESQSCYGVDLEVCPLCPLEYDVSRRFTFGEGSLSQERYTTTDCSGDVDTITLVEGDSNCNAVDSLGQSFEVTLTPFVLDDGTMETTMEGEGDDVGYHSVNMLVVFGLFFVNYFL